MMNTLIALLLAPFFLSIVVRTKAVFAGRRGAPLLQPYYDIAKLIRKGSVYSETTTWIFRAGPVIGLAATLVTLLFVPFGGSSSLVFFPGDFILLAYLLGLARFVTVIAALDTGSSFEGMGASREVIFSALAEPALLLGLAMLSHLTGALSLSEMIIGLTNDSWGTVPAPLLLISASFFVVFLAENARIPVDDPNTHLELTMIHEVMVLDHCGVDLAFIHYAAALKAWVLGAILVGMVIPSAGWGPAGGLIVALFGMVVLAIAVGTVESVMARLRLVAVPRLLIGAITFSLVALLLGFTS